MYAFLSRYLVDSHISCLTHGSSFMAIPKLGCSLLMFLFPCINPRSQPSPPPPPPKNNKTEWIFPAMPLWKINLFLKIYIGWLWSRRRSLKSNPTVMFRSFMIKVLKSSTAAYAVSEPPGAEICLRMTAWSIGGMGVPQGSEISLYACLWSVPGCSSKALLNPYPSVWRCEWGLGWCWLWWQRNRA